MANCPATNLPSFRLGHHLCDGRLTVNDDFRFHTVGVTCAFNISHCGN